MSPHREHVCHPELHVLPWHPDASSWVERIRDLTQSVWLDSGRPGGARGRYDIISASPLACVITRRGDGHDPMQLLREALAKYFAKTAALPDIPFVGGAIGLLGYEALAITKVPAPKVPALSFPDAHFGLYSWAIICDHCKQSTHLVIHPATPPKLREELLRRLKNTAPPRTTSTFQLRGNWRSEPAYANYTHAIERIAKYIHAGDCYQVNFARRWHNTYQGDPWHAYLKLRAFAKAPFAAWMETADGTVLCQSPERFVQCIDRKLLTEPIKGTAARDSDAERDQVLGEALQRSEKNRAENLMIVDLLRNDFGQVCTPGSVRVKKLFALEKFATVQHLVSTVEGELRADIHPLDAWHACFPGGSITGAPKIRAMQIIAELEPFRRSVFCGSIGYFSVCGRMDSNIAIRTLLALKSDLYAWAGGGIVADSRCEEEFAEALLKIEPILNSLSASA